jgi:hypothetical protein
MPKYYESVTQVELADGSVIPVGSYTTGTCITTEHTTDHGIQVWRGTEDSLGRFGVLKVTAYSLVYGVAEIEIVLGADGLAHPGTGNSYRLKTFSSQMTPTITMNPGTNSSNISTGVYITFQFPHNVSLVARMDCEGCTILEAPATAHEELTLEPIFVHPILIENQDYGTDMPSPGNKGRIFFRKI